MSEVSTVAYDALLNLKTVKASGITIYFLYFDTSDNVHLW